MILFDAHVHIYDCFNLDGLFTAAFAHFTRVIRQQKNDNAPLCVLMLAESAGWCFFDRLANMTGNESHGRRWEVQRTGENHGLAVTHVDYPETIMRIAAGRQIVTAERLEVLALLTGETLPDGVPLAEAVDRILLQGGIAVCPWGAGKWVGKRGKILADYLENDKAGRLFLGDSGGRPRLWAHDKLLSRAAAGQRLLSGSDPLPLAGEEARVGSFGGYLDGDWSLAAPLASLSAQLGQKETRIHAFGSSMPAVDFIRNQISLRRK